MFSLFDTHCHLYDHQFDADLDAVIERAVQNSVGAMLIPAENFITTIQVNKLCAIHNNIPLYAAGGIHPHYAEQGKEEFSKLKSFIRDNNFTAIGEIGLDYYRLLSGKDAQREIFIDCLELAAELEKPILLHNRDATQDMLSILQNWLRQLPESTPLKDHPGVFHAFNGDPLVIDFALKHHFYLGIGGMITFKNAKDLRTILRQVPLDSLLLETDSPYMSPHPYRGKRNEPAYVHFVAQELAQISELPLEKVIEQTALNAQHLIGRSHFK